MMAGGAVQQNGIFSNPHHHNQQPHMESDPPDSRKRPLETPTEASSTKRTNTGGKSNDGDAGSCWGFGQCCFVLRQAVENESRLNGSVACTHSDTQPQVITLMLRRFEERRHISLPKSPFPPTLKPRRSAAFDRKETMRGVEGGLGGKPPFPFAHVPAVLSPVRIQNSRIGRVWVAS